MVSFVLRKITAELPISPNSLQSPIKSTITVILTNMFIVFITPTISQVKLQEYYFSYCSVVCKETP